MTTVRSTRNNAGFTLIEIMAAVTVLAIMVVFLSSVFSNTSKIWKIGNKRVESNNSGRAAIEFMAREIGSAVIGNGGKLQLFTDVSQDSVYGSANAKSDRIVFMSSAAVPQYVSSVSYKVFRQVKQSVFAVVSTNGNKGPYTLVLNNRFNPTDVSQSYQNSTWLQSLSDYVTDQAYSQKSLANMSVVAENVRNLEIFVYVLNPSTGAPMLVSDYQSWVAPPGLPAPVPPFYIDIYLEVLAEEDATRASEGMTGDKEIQRATHRYHTRVYMANAQGAERD